MGDNHSHDRAEQVALFRYGVISEAVSGRLTPAERGLIVGLGGTHLGDARGCRTVLRPGHDRPVGGRLSA